MDVFFYGEQTACHFKLASLGHGAVNTYSTTQNTYRMVHKKLFISESELE